jgi:hypothetical protein
MPRPAKRSFLAQLDRNPSPVEIAKTVAHFKDRVERNKTRRRWDGEPPAPAPAPVEPRPKGGGFSGGAAAMLVFED